MLYYATNRLFPKCEVKNIRFSLLRVFPHNSQTLPHLVVNSTTFPDSRQISQHFYVFQTTGHPVS